MDHLSLNTLKYPVRCGELYKSGNDSGEYCWGIEIQCDESPELDYRNWRDDREEGPFDWAVSTEPWLYAQMLPLRADSPDDLIGHEFSFPQTPYDDPPDWPRGIGWPFFCLCMFEHDFAFPMRVAFTGKRLRQFRVEIAGQYPSGDMVYDLRVQAWLEWK